MRKPSRLKFWKTLPDGYNLCDFSLWLPQTDVELMTSHMGNVPYVVKTIKPMLTIRLKSATTLKDVKVHGKRVIDSIGASHTY